MCVLLESIMTLGYMCRVDDLLLDGRISLVLINCQTAASQYKISQCSYHNAIILYKILHHSSAADVRVTCNYTITFTSHVRRNSHHLLYQESELQMVRITSTISNLELIEYLTLRCSYSRLDSLNIYISSYF